VNADLPIVYNQNRNDRKADCETYLHRIGRTGRFGDVGIALNIVDHESMKIMNEIRNHYNIENLNELKDLN
jgi:ATP-dependent RNA helicase DDX19/DBP5